MLESADALSGRLRGAHRQQLGGKPDTPLGAWPFQLAVRRFAEKWPARCCGDDAYPVRKAQWARSLCLSEGRADEATDAEEQRH